MKIIGFNLNKISVEKISSDFKGLKIESNITIEKISSIDTDFFKKEEEAVQIAFNYDLNYNPNLAKLAFSGDIVILADQKDAKKILKQWEDKKISEEIKISLFNFILRKTSIKALELEDELNLPLHIAFPSLQLKKKE
jgi:hypothetical protein